MNNESQKKNIEKAWDLLNKSLDELDKRRAHCASQHKEGVKIVADLAHQLEVFDIAIEQLRVACDKMLENTNE